MKSLKLGLIAIIVAITMVGIANAGPVSGNNKFAGKVISLTLEQAVTNLGLVAAISHQVTLEEVLSSPSIMYTAKVIYENYTFEITGSRDQWILFFKMINEVGIIVSSNTVKAT